MSALILWHFDLRRIFDFSSRRKGKKTDGSTKHRSHARPQAHAGMTCFAETAGTQRIFLCALAVSRKSCNFAELAKPKMNKAPTPYSTEEEPSKSSTLRESALALEEQETFVLPDDVDYASIVEGILQVTPDIEEEIAAADRGETVSMDEFKTMFAKWLE